MNNCDAIWKWFKIIYDDDVHNVEVKFYTLLIYAAASN